MWRARVAPSPGGSQGSLRWTKATRLPGVLLGSPIYALPAVLVSRAGALAFLGTLGVLAAGLVLVWAGLRLLGEPDMSVTPAGRLAGSVGLPALAVGAVPVLAWTVVGGPGWATRLLLLLVVSTWTASAGLAAGPGGVTGPASATAFAALLFAGFLGYALSAGVAYFLGPPLGFLIVLAGCFLAGGPAARCPDRTRVLAVAYAAAALVLSFLAFLDVR